jgi:hypothetical protein
MPLTKDRLPRLRQILDNYPQAEKIPHCAAAAIWSISRPITLRFSDAAGTGLTAATRALNAILQYAFGKHGRRKFRRRDRYNSFESKEAKSTIIWRDGAVRIVSRVIPAILDSTNACQSETT